MEAPRKGLSLRDLNEAIKTHYQQMYEDTTNTGWHCLACASEIQTVACAVAIHRTPPGGACEESGEADEILSLPYCPQCEGRPASTSTCVHLGALLTFSSGIKNAHVGEMEDGSMLIRA
jgi:hypothetical protein